MIPWYVLSGLKVLNTNLDKANASYCKNVHGKTVPCIRVAGDIVFQNRDKDYQPIPAPLGQTPVAWARRAIKRATYWVEAAERVLQEDNVSVDAAWWVV